MLCVVQCLIIKYNSNIQCVIYRTMFSRIVATEDIFFLRCHRRHIFPGRIRILCCARKYFFCCSTRHPFCCIRKHVLCGCRRQYFVTVWCCCIVVFTYLYVIKFLYRITMITRWTLMAIRWLSLAWRTVSLRAWRRAKLPIAQIWLAKVPPGWQSRGTSRRCSA